MMKNVFCFVLKTLFVLSFFCHIETQDAFLAIKSAKNGPEMYLLTGVNPIFVTLRFYDGHSPDQKNVRLWFFKEPYADSLNRCK